MTRALLVSLVLAGVTLLSEGAAPGATAPTVVARSNLQLTRLADDVVPDLGTYVDLGPIAPSQQLDVVITLRHDDAAVSALEASLTDPASPDYESWLTPAEFQARFDAPAANSSSIATWARTGASSSRT